MAGPEQMTIDGRAATVIYLDAEFNPVEKEQATMVKVMFEDGEHRFGVIAPPENQQ